MLVFLLIILLVVVAITDTPIEKKIQETFKEVKDNFYSEVIEPAIFSIKEKINPTTWEYSSSWLSKGRTVLHIKLVGSSGESRYVKYYCNSSGFSFRDQNRKYVWGEEGDLFSQEQLEFFWRDCVDNKRFSDV